MKFRKSCCTTPDIGSGCVSGSEKFSHDDFGLTLTFFLWQGQICFLSFEWEEFMELVEDLGEKVNEYSEIKE